jgi:hypothetical protein
LARWWVPYFRSWNRWLSSRQKNDVLTAKVDELRHEVDQQAGQVKVLIEFVRSALDDRVEKRAQAAARAVLADYEAKTDTKSRGKRK